MTRDRSEPQADTATSHPAPDVTAPELHWSDRAPPATPRRGLRLARIATTILCFTILALGALIVWNRYITAPWTRDGRVRVQVASVASQVSGQIVELRVADGQFVHKGEVLFVIDPSDFQVRLASAGASVKQAAADVQVKLIEADRLLHLSQLATTRQQQQEATAAADEAEATLQSAQQAQEQAEINLLRTRVTSPVNGFVDNLLLRVGDWAETGSSKVSVVDTDSFWIDGYFEETKLGGICIGDRAQAELMGYARPIEGRIAAIGRGISVSNATPSTQGLPRVDAIFTWVRLAQRVPVRMRITAVPPGVPLIAGLTATVTVRSGTAGPTRPDRPHRLGTTLREWLGFPPPQSPGCIPTDIGTTGTVARIPIPKANAFAPPQQIDPGLGGGMTAKPQRP